MEFKIRASNTFIMNMFLVLFALLMAAWDFILPSVPDGFWHYRYFGWLLIGFTRLIASRKYLYKMLTGKPVLIVNNACVYDLVENIKYNWNDVKEIYEDNAYLYISVYKPEAYIKYIHNPIKKAWAVEIANPVKKHHSELTGIW